MRVHGDEIIRRRSDVSPQKTYSGYTEYLRKDFHNICGYCGKPREISSRDYHIDHFVPKSKAPEREADYENLVYCCCVCNYKKSDNWPTNDPSLPHDGKVGFVDPASEDFDEHLMRDDDTGCIHPKTDVGLYICNIFDFGGRPIEIVWKAVELQKIINQFNERINTLSSNEYQKYAQINAALCELKKNILNME